MYTSKRYRKFTEVSGPDLVDWRRFTFQHVGKHSDTHNKGIIFTLHNLCHEYLYLNSTPTQLLLCFYLKQKTYRVANKKYFQNLQFFFCVFYGHKTNVSEHCLFKANNKMTISPPTQHRRT